MLSLNQGTNLIGVRIREYSRTTATTNWSWIDFKWLTIVRGEICTNDYCYCGFDLDYTNLKKKSEAVMGEGRYGYSYVDANNLRQGVHREFFDQAMTRLAGRGCYQNDKREGRWTGYYDSGLIWEITTYKANKKVGLYESFWANGSRSWWGTYDANEKATGFWSLFYEDGTPWMFCTYLPDELVHVTKYYTNGVTKSEFTANVASEWRDEDRPAIGPAVQYYDNGQKSAEWTLIFVPVLSGGTTSMADGMWRQWYRNGNKKAEYALAQGNRDGPYTTWYENGHFQEVGQYKKWVKVGHWTYYAEDGTVTKEEDYPE